jgi:hypothetical protein
MRGDGPFLTRQVKAAFCASWAGIGHARAGILSCRNARGSQTPLDGCGHGAQALPCCDFRLTQRDNLCHQCLGLRVRWREQPP